MGSSEAHASRAVASARGMVATSHPLSSRVGVEVLRNGGHAVDAAIAANAMLGLVEPMSCGLGGDLFAVVWDASDDGLATGPGCAHPHHWPGHGRGARGRR